MQRGAIWWSILIVLLGDIRTARAEDPPPFQRAALVRVEGPISSWFESFLRQKLARVEQAKFDLLILEIDSPGGGLRETIDLCARLEKLPIHTVAYVPDQAISGGAILALACDDIVIGPRARIGDCGPIFMDDDFLFRHAPEKIRSDLVARVRLLAENNGYPPALAEAMVDMNAAVVRLENAETGDIKFVTKRELETVQAPWVIKETLPESGEGRFLTLNGKRAVEVKLATTTVENREELSKHLGLTNPPRVFDITTLDRTIFVLNHWLMGGLLICIGLISIAYELSAPGLGGGGLIATICFALFFWSRFLGGTADWLEVILFTTGVLFLALEIFVIPGFGITGVLGLLCMIASLVFASLDFTLPETNAEMIEASTSLLTVVAAGVISAVVVGLLIRHVESLPFLNRLLLKPPEPRTSFPSTDLGASNVPTGPRLGDVGVTTTMLRPAGKAQFGDQWVDVLLDGGFLDAGVPVEIVDVEGTRIVVRRTLL